MTADPILESMTLNLTEACNMRCSYCCVPVGVGQAMSPRVARSAVDLFLRHSCGDKVSVCFFGGEPFLETMLMEHVAAWVREGAEQDADVRMGATTNGTVLDRAALRLCKEQSMELTVSFDGIGSRPERRLQNGSDATADIVAGLEKAIGLSHHCRVSVRMTVTPDNVSHLTTNIKNIAARGAERVVYEPAYERHWSDEAVLQWGAEHHHLGAWLKRLRQADLPAPELVGWQRILRRLKTGAPRDLCAAGRSHVAVSSDGSIFPCHRFAVASFAEDYRLGHVSDGFDQPEVLELFASLRSEQFQGEEGTCHACPARDGCTLVCGGLGFQLGRSIVHMPAQACRLMRAQVDAIGSALFMAGPRARPQRQRSRRQRQERPSAGIGLRAPRPDLQR